MALPGRLRERMGALAERDARASALVHDRTYRASVAAALGLAVNATYAAGNLALGVAGASAWLVTWGCYYAALAAMLLSGVLIIALFNYYSSVVREEPFLRNFGRMAAISLGVAALSFGIGYLVRSVFGIEV